MNNLKAFRVRGGQATEIVGSSVALERELQSLIEGNMEAMLGIRFLASEYGPTSGANRPFGPGRERDTGHRGVQALP
ncbi:hypothetical protein [Streptomyces sp. x-80]|uniref:hypothetical protein n=1 Tax=Streptomyces sp. x-80 TaxID=2789282 RepID=UPI0039807D3C